MSLIGYIYKLFNYYIKQNIPEIKSVDLYFDQFNTDNTGNTDSTSNPKILIEIQPIDFDRMFNGIQNAEVFVTLHIGIDIFNSFKTSELTDKNIQYLNLLSNIYKQLEGISSFNLPNELKTTEYILHNINRSALTFATNSGSVKISTITFSLIAEDNSLCYSLYEDSILEINNTINIT